MACHRFLLIVALLLPAICTTHALAETEGECYITEIGQEICKNNLNDVDDNAFHEHDDNIIDSSDDDDDDDEYSECTDKDKDCGYWAERGECDANAAYMHRHCPVSCHTCPDIEIDNVIDGLSDRTDEKKKLLKLIMKYGVPQSVTGAESSATLLVIKEALVYMKNFVYAKNPSHNMSAQTIAKCRNRDESCSFWAATGECDTDPSYMTTACAPSCKSCHLIDFATRCPIDPNAKPALAPGDLNAMFDRIIKEAADGRSKGYTVTVHSRPSAESIADSIIDEEKDLEQPPWILTFDNFLSDEECDYLIQIGYKYEYERSVSVGDEQFDGTLDSTVSEGRTSENAWCDVHSGCRDEPVVSKIYDKMSNVTGIPPDNSEDLQLLKYEVTQFYQVHHDYIEEERDRQDGPRILTFFLYLSDDGLQGGGTRFTSLDPPLTIQPKKGRALLWPSVLNSKPRDIDDRMEHEALPVEKGTKFAANAWIHLFNERKADEMGCA
mmetsp:Transcript_20758/g.42377  ORF Transcript_20758/g.42377 Transcript_20758/m.42377 type:complete len:495 (+) Transcript_20758:64-1548(+)